MVMWSMLYNSEPVPTHELSPIDNFHGHWIVTAWRIKTPWPIRAPNSRRIAHRSRFGHQTLVTTSDEIATHSACVANPRPLS
jgi:hypothetical protein